MSLHEVRNAVGNYLYQFDEAVAKPVSKAENFLKLTTPIFDAMVKLMSLSSLKPLHQYSFTLKEGCNFASWITLFSAVTNKSGKLTGSDGLTTRIFSTFLLFGKTIQCLNVLAMNGIIGKFTHNIDDDYITWGNIPVIGRLFEESAWMALEGGIITTGLVIKASAKAAKYSAQDNKAKDAITKTELVVALAGDVAKIAVITTKKYGFFDKGSLNLSPWNHALCITTGALAVAKDVLEINKRAGGK